jgi:nitrate/nitrite transport system permease protein
VSPRTTATPRTTQRRKPRLVAAQLDDEATGADADAGPEAEPAGPALVLGHAADGPPDLAAAPSTAPPAPPAAVLDQTLARRAGRLLLTIALGLVGFAALVAVWQVGSSRVANLPPPSDTFTKLQDLLSDPFYDRGPNDKGIGLRMLASLQRVFSGFGLAVAVGVPVGLLIGASKRAWQMFNPVIQLLRPVSPLAWFPIWLVVFSDSGRAAIWVIFITSLWPTVLSTAAAAAAVPSDQQAVALVFRFGKVAYLRHVLVPNSLPAIVTGMRVSMGIAWMVIVAVEMLATGGGGGIGSYVWEQYNALNLSSMVAAIVLIGVVGFGLDLVFLRLARAVAIEEPVT